jgi:hypothetical protein
MALMIILLPVIALAVLSLLWGNDSRETMRSKEQELASYGMRWPHTITYEQELAEELAAALEKQHDAPTKRAP